MPSAPYAHYRFQVTVAAFPGLGTLAFRLMLDLRLDQRPRVVASGRRHSTVYWRIQQGTWTSVRWVTVHEYLPGLIRLRNDLVPPIPQRVWPFALPAVRTMELTFHWSELVASVADPVFALFDGADNPEGVVPWPVFDGENTYPQYAWTPRAKRYYEENKPW
jgi:hypothetical protein